MLPESLHRTLRDPTKPAEPLSLDAAGSPGKADPSKEADKGEVETAKNVPQELFAAGVADGCCRGPGKGHFSLGCCPRNGFGPPRAQGRVGMILAGPPGVPFAHMSGPHIVR